MRHFIKDLKREAEQMALTNYETYGYVIQYYVSSTINPYIVVSGYDIQDAYEKIEDTAHPYSTVQELIENSVIVYTVKP